MPSMSTIIIALKAGALPDATMAQIRQLAAGRQVIQTTDRAELERLLPETEIAFGNYPADLLPRAGSLRWYQSYSAGMDDVLEEFGESLPDFAITTASGVHPVPIAEHVLAFMLAFARDFPAARRDQDERTWGKQKRRVFELKDSTMVLIGTGRIGQRIARYAAALGVNVIGVRRNAEEPVEGIPRMHSSRDLKEILSEADFTVMTAPLTQSTRRMLGAEEFAAMKPGSFFINIGRGATVDEAAMTEALSSGHLGGAGLDVFETEPLPESSPLWELPNVMITAHYSGATPEYSRRAAAIFLANLRRYVTGQPLQNLLEPGRGY